MSQRQIDHRSLHILKERATRLARVEGESQVAETTEPCVAFMVCGQCFGVPLDSVVYAGRLRHLTPLPGGSAYLLGITVLSGHLCSVLDVAAFLDLRHQGLGDVTCCLVISTGGREIGLAAEQLIGIEEVPSSRVISIGSVGSTAIVHRAAFLDRLQILLIDLERLIGDPRLRAPGAPHG